MFGRNVANALRSTAPVASKVTRESVRKTETIVVTLASLRLETSANPYQKIAISRILLYL